MSFRCLVAQCTFLLLIVLDLVQTNNHCKPLVELPCENGECVDGNFWCNNSTDCQDGTDEKYCKLANWRSSDPNKCPEGYFKCQNGPCIPNVGKCGNFLFCKRDNKEDCVNTVEKSVDKPQEPEIDRKRTKVEKPVDKAQEVFTDKVNGRTFDNYYVTSDGKYETQLQDAIKWLISERDQDFGWGEETARAMTAFYISQTSPDRERNLMMKKQLEVQLAVALAKNKTSPIALSDLALYINALMATCRNTRNFNGFDLVDLLRQRVNTEQQLNKFINPSVYLTLCLNGMTSNMDVMKIQDLMSNNPIFDRIDLYSLAVLASACYEKISVFQQRKLVSGFINKLVRKVYEDRLPNNVYDAALILQALDAAGIDEISWKEDAMNVLLGSQNVTTGSFENILGTYYAVPVLAGKTLLSLNQHCSEQTHKDNFELEVIKNQPRSVNIHYTLRYGNPVEMQQSLHLKIPPGTNFLDVMRLAEEIDPNYRFKLDEGLKTPQVYSIGGIPNDAEKGLYWRLYLVSSAAKFNGQVATTVPFIFNGSNGIKGLIMQPNDEAIFWLAPMS